MLEQKVLDAYADGSPLELIIESFNIPHKQVVKILIDYKESNRFKRTFTDEFKKMIASRDMSGVARRTIASELELNVSTVKKSCEQFGQAVKEKATSVNAYTIVEGVHNLDVCPECQNDKVNEIDSITENVNTKGIFCMKCDSEHLLMPITEKQKDKDDKEVIVVVGYDVYKVNFEYLEE